MTYNAAIILRISRIGIGRPHCRPGNTMARKEISLIGEHDIYVLTEQAVKELRGAGTSLSPAVIELLVRIDGYQEAGRLAETARLLAPDAVFETLRKLLGEGLIRPRPRQGGLDDSLDFFGGKSPAQPTRKAMTEAKAEASAGVTTLQKTGYYVRIARRDAARSKAPADRPLSVFVIEDEPLLAKFLKQFLAFEGYQARTASNREEINAAFRNPPPPDLVLLDVMLPDADGFDVLLKMRQHPALKKVPVIMLTAKATREAVLKGLAGGADGYITKPFEADALIQAIKAVMGLPKNPAGKKPGAGS